MFFAYYPPDTEIFKYLNYINFTFVATYSPQPEFELKVFFC